MVQVYFLGWIYDGFGSYDGGFYLAGGMIAISGLILCFIPLIRYFRDRKIQKDCEDCEKSLFNCFKHACWKSQDRNNKDEYYQQEELLPQQDNNKPTVQIVPPQPPSNSNSEKNRAPKKG